MTSITQMTPAPTMCHACGVFAVAVVCPNCSIERPAYAAMKNITAKERAARERGAQPLSFPLPPCSYYPNSLCDCGLRGCCVPAT